MTSVSGEVLPYDNRIFVPDWDLVEDPVKNYFAASNPNSTAIYTALHVQNSTKVPIFEMKNADVHAALVADNLSNYAEYV